ncbi:MAG: efflux RND transporter periplasmic adaptor subunit [Pseudoflavonifractor sp.]|nr:efflux RND transporter periplasmic adaptor subunit [Alloprevotella sp.]MCM1117233.1 efflux RND transporter periplasmic adaptor subunit [Pseudoflavonifractor sp.]
MRFHYLLPAIALASVAVISCRHSSKEGEEDGRTPLIDVAQVEQKAVTFYHTYPGSLHAQSSIDLVARVAGYLRSQNYENGELVEKGALLFTIEDTSYRDAVAQAQSQLKTAEAELAYNTSHYEAVKQAAAADAASKMEVEQARSDMESSRQSVNTAKAALSTAQTNLQYCYVRAPFRGRVGASVPGVGAYLTGTGETLATIYDDAEVRADFYIDDGSYIAMLRDENPELLGDLEKMPVAFGDTLPHTYTAKLVYMSPSVDPTTGTLELRAMIDNPYGELKDGMYATIRLPYDMDKDAILVKDASISTDQHGKYIYTVNDSNRVVYTPIETGDIVNDTMRVVTKGIDPGTRYVTRALLKVRPDMEIKPRMVK